MTDEGTKARRNRAFQQQLFVVDHTLQTNGLDVFILGTTSKVYQVTIVEKTAPTCTCVDFKIRKRPCKHILFLVEKLFRQNIQDFSSQDVSYEIIQNIYKERFPNMVQYSADDSIVDEFHDLINKVERLKVSESVNKCRNDECCICLTDITSKDILICKVCQNGVHNKCWGKWTQHSRAKKCVYCRTLIKSDLDQDSVIKLQIKK